MERSYRWKRTLCDFEDSTTDLSPKRWLARCSYRAFGWSYRRLIWVMIIASKHWYGRNRPDWRCFSEIDWRQKQPLLPLARRQRSSHRCLLHQVRFKSRVDVVATVVAEIEAALQAQEALYNQARAQWRLNVKPNARLNLKNSRRMSAKILTNWKGKHSL